MTLAMRKNWFKSTRSAAQSHCVEAAVGQSGDIHLRDSKNTDGGVLSFDSATWTGFIRGVKSGDFSRR